MSRLRACAAVIQDQQILMVKHTPPGRPPFWTLPGGAVEAGEAPSDAAVRELWEETGIAGRVVRHLFDADYQGGTEECFLVELIVDGAEASLGFDPERTSDGQVLSDIAWHDLDVLSEDHQVRRVLHTLAQPTDD